MDETHNSVLDKKLIHFDYAAKFALFINPIIAGTDIRNEVEMLVVFRPFSTHRCM